MLKVMEETLKEALSLVELDAYSELKPLARLKIYTLMGNQLDAENLFFANTQILTLKRVLPTWSELITDNNLPFYLLDNTEKLFQKKMLQSEAEQIFVESGRDILLAEISNSFPDEAFAVACAALDTFRIALYGFDKWQDVILYEDDTDDDLLIWGNDSAKWASIAIAGWVTDTTPETKQKRAEFWKWWLSEAIPQAWELAQQSKLEAK